MAIQCSSGLTQLGYLLKDISDVPAATSAVWFDYINKFVYRFLLGIAPERFVKQVSFSLISGTSVYALDTDFRDMTAYTTGIYQVDGQGNITDTRLPITSPGQSTFGFYIANGNYNFTPPPQQTLALMKRYTPSITTISSANQYFTLDGTVSGVVTIPDEYIDYIVKALNCQYTQWDEDIGAESFADQRFQNVLNELCDNIRQQASPMNLPDFSSIYGSGNSDGYGGFGYGGY